MKKSAKFIANVVLLTMALTITFVMYKMVKEAKVTVSKVEEVEGRAEKVIINLNDEDAARELGKEFGKFMNEAEEAAKEFQKGVKEGRADTVDTEITEEDAIFMDKSEEDW